MNFETAVAVSLLGFFALIAAVAIWGESPQDRQQEIGIECVKAGNEWVSGWGGYECLRKQEGK